MKLELEASFRARELAVDLIDAVEANQDAVGRDLPNRGYNDELVALLAYIASLEQRLRDDTRHIAQERDMREHAQRAGADWAKEPSTTVEGVWMRREYFDKLQAAYNREQRWRVAVEANSEALGDIVYAKWAEQQAEYTGIALDVLLRARIVTSASRSRDRWQQIAVALARAILELSDEA